MTIGLKKFSYIYLATILLTGHTLQAQEMEPGFDPEPSSLQLKLQQTHVNGLLVTPLPSGKEAGQVTKMNLTALPDMQSDSLPHFSQEVGPEMQKALKEVKKFIHLRHKGWPANHNIEIAFEEKYSGKDGPSAAVACGLLLDSAFSGKGISLDVAFTGDMNADGSVQPIGGVPAKVRGATNSRCKLVAIPKKNESALADVLVLDGPAPLVNITIFSIDSFEQAAALATTERATELQQALEEFETIRTVLQRDPRAMAQILRTPQAAARLQSILAKAPNCLSAQYLLLFSQRRSPAMLSLGGSIEAATNSAQAIMTSINLDAGTRGTSTLKPDELGGTIYKLQNLRPRTDKRVWPFLDALVDYAEVVRGALLNPIKTGARLQDFQQKAGQTATAVRSAHESLMTDPGVRESLGL